MRGGAAGLCRVELETVRDRGSFCAEGRSWLPLLEVDAGVALGGSGQVIWRLELEDERKM